MTLDTHIYITTQIDPEKVLEFFNRELLHAPEDVQTSRDAKSISNAPMQGLAGWLFVYRNESGEPVFVNEGHSKWCSAYDGGDCDDECSDHPDRIPPTHYVNVSIDTSYSYRDDEGRGCGDLHADFIFRLGMWLEAQGADFYWENEFTGEIWHKYEHLRDLADGGEKADQWFTNTVLPAIESVSLTP